LRLRFETFEPGEVLPVRNYLKNRKLKKFFSRETMAAMICVSKLLEDHEISEETSFFYATSVLEFEDYGLTNLALHSTDEDDQFSQRRFIEDCIPKISPLNQFRLLQNMPLCFISIEKNIKGDNAVVYSSGQGLLRHALYADNDMNILIGATRVYKSGKAESGFAIVDKDEIRCSKFLCGCDEAIDMFREWSNEGKIV